MTSRRLYPMRFRLSLLPGLAGLPVAACHLRHGLAAPPRPNILFVLMDDVRRDELGWTEANNGWSGLALSLRSPCRRHYPAAGKRGEDAGRAKQCEHREASACTRGEHYYKARWNPR
jgi:hypothetical protein